MLACMRASVFAVVVAGLACALASCGSASPEVVGNECLGGIDESDRCPTLPRACLTNFDPNVDDGCPDPGPHEVRFAEGATTLSEAVASRLSENCADLSHLRAGVVVRLVVNGTDALGTQRIEAVERALSSMCGPSNPTHEVRDDIVEGVVAIELGGC